MPLSTPLRNEASFARENNAAPNASGEQERLKAELFITYNGRHYEYNRYRYDRLVDAVDYARLQRSKSSGDDDIGPLLRPEDIETPDESQRQLMADLAITFQDGMYRLGAFRYDRLTDAVNYARLPMRSD